MPLYEYHCPACDANLELLVRNFDEQPNCPECGSNKLEKQLSMAAAPSIAGSNLPLAQSPSPTCGRPQCGSGCMFD